MDERTCIRVINVDVTSSVQAEDNKCSAVAYVHGQAQTLLLTRVATTTSTWRLGALPTQRTLALWEVSVQHFQTVRTRPSRSTSAVAAWPKPDMFADLPHELQVKLKNNMFIMHRATHAESYAHCVNCDTNCFKTSDVNLLRDSFNLLAQQRIRSSGITEPSLAFHPSCITSSRSSTFADSLRSAPLYSIQFAFDQSSTRFQISPTRSQTRRHSASFENLTPFDLTP